MLEWNKKSGLHFVAALTCVRQHLLLSDLEKLPECYNPVTPMDKEYVLNPQTKKICAQIESVTLSLIDRMATNSLETILNPSSILDVMSSISTHYLEESNECLKMKWKIALESWKGEMEKTDVHDIGKEELETEQQVTFLVACLKHSLAYKLSRLKNLAVILMTTLGSLHYSASSTIYWLYACSYSYVGVALEIFKDLRTYHFLEGKRVSSVWGNKTPCAGMGDVMKVSSSVVPTLHRYTNPTFTASYNSHDRLVSLSSSSDIIWTSHVTCADLSSSSSTATTSPALPLPLPNESEPLPVATSTPASALAPAPAPPPAPAPAPPPALEPAPAPALVPLPPSAPVPSAQLNPISTSVPTSDLASPSPLPPTSPSTPISILRPVPTSDLSLPPQTPLPTPPTTLSTSSAFRSMRIPITSVPSSSPPHRVTLWSTPRSTPRPSLNHLTSSTYPSIFNTQPRLRFCAVTDSENSRHTCTLHDLGEVLKEDGRPIKESKGILELSSLLIERASSSEATELLGPLMVAFSYMTTMEVWNKLHSHYLTISRKEMDPKEKESQRNRLLNLLIKWIRSESNKLGVEMLDKKVIESILYFCEGTLTQDGLRFSANKIKSALGFGEVQSNKLMEEWESFKKLKSLSLYNLTTKLPEVFFQYYTPFQMASQMTLVDHHLFGKIQKWELLKCRWAKERTRILARNVLELIKHNNMISHYVATVLLIQERVHARLKVMKYFINVADILCHEMYNFSSGLAILNAFSMACVSRLNLDSQIPSNYLSKWKTLLTLQNPEGKWQNLRSAMAKAPGAEMIPYMGLALGNIMMVEEGNKEEQTIEKNLEKYEMLDHYISEFMRNKDCVRKIEKIEPIYVLCDSVPILDEEFLYELSLIREPKKK
eukprot:TRINITY_DN4061_c0_g2_i1.p1 TRINITY_DN4061_c0_g2~~TRINITY_DN4061_c0_g2_i1.p1  ORF type:complete len:885 (+),score=172.06 TRINITY_DN4061_c0_g2_i1:186-2840(+)